MSDTIDRQQAEIDSRQDAIACRQAAIADLMEKLRTGVLCQAVVMNVLSEHEPPDPEVVKAAREEWVTDDDLEIDDKPICSEGDGGTWVSAWVWVPEQDGDEEDGDEEDGGEVEE